MERMPKLPCRCGYVHNLSPIPDDGFQVFPEVHGAYLVVHDGREEVYACLEEPQDEQGAPVAGTWVARPLDESEVSRIRGWGG